MIGTVLAYTITDPIISSKKKKNIDLIIKITAFIFFVTSFTWNIKKVLLTVQSSYQGRYFAVGSADSLVSLWDISEMLCVKTFTKLEWVFPSFFFFIHLHAKQWPFGTFLRWPVRTISFNHTGEYIASASEDLFIDIVSINVTRIDIYTSAWHHALCLRLRPYFSGLCLMKLCHSWRFYNGSN